MKNDEEFPQNRLWKCLESITEAPRLGFFFSRKHIFSLKTAEMHSQGVRNIFETALPPLFIGKKGGACRPEAS